MASLYEINNAIESFDFIVDEETGEITNYSDFELLEIAKEEKREQLALYVKSLRAESKAIKEEAKSLTDRAKATESKADSIEKYLAKDLDGEKFKTARVSVSYRKSTKVEIINELDVPAQFKHFVTEVKVDKKAIKEAFKTGEVKGAALVTSNNIQIK